MNFRARDKRRLRRKGKENKRENSASMY